MPPVLPPFLLGLIMAPIVKRMAMPLARGIIQTSVNLAVEVKRAAQEAGEDLQDLAAEATSEMFAAEFQESGQPASAPKGGTATAGAKKA